MDLSFKLRYYLYPFSFLYGIGIWIRNMLFDWNILPSKQFSVPVICVGNLEVGGTGKTPMTEYLIRLLADRYRLAVVSRGYKRKSKGYILADENSTPQNIGDEAFLIHSKFPNIMVAVDKNRCRGIDRLLALPEDVRPQVILLDDAFQHRYLQPSLAILMTNCNRLYYNDKLLPVGRLREPSSGVKRANIVMVSKCDESFQPIDCRIIGNEMKLLAYQSLFFSTVAYQGLENIFNDRFMPLPLNHIRKDDAILLITGIANPMPLVEKMQTYSDNVRTISFPDHHNFTRKDIKLIETELAQMKQDRIMIICTEKDAVRLRFNTFLPDEWKAFMYKIPISMEILFGKNERLDEQIMHHISIIEKSKILRT